MSFGENLKKARIAAGLTQTELAKRTGVTERSIYNYEKNSRAPKIDVAESAGAGDGCSSGQRGKGTCTGAGGL